MPAPHRTYRMVNVSKRDANEFAAAAASNALLWAAILEANFQVDGDASSFIMPPPAPPPPTPPPPSLPPPSSPPDAPPSPPPAPPLPAPPLPSLPPGSPPATLASSPSPSRDTEYASFSDDFEVEGVVEYVEYPPPPPPPPPPPDLISQRLPQRAGVLRRDTEYVSFSDDFEARVIADVAATAAPLTATLASSPSPSRDTEYVSFSDDFEVEGVVKYVEYPPPPSPPPPPPRCRRPSRDTEYVSFSDDFEARVITDVAASFSAATAARSHLAAPAATLGRPTP